MLKFIVLIVIIAILLVYNDFLRYAVFHPKKTIPWGLSDIKKYFKDKEWNKCPDIGKVKMFVSNGTQVFGNGKTLSMVMYAYHIFNKYNDLTVRGRSGDIVKQRVHIISNVKLNGIPYIKWRGAAQFGEIDKMKKEHPDIFKEDDIFLFLLDEAGTIFNSRDYKDNMNSQFLTTLLTSRHHNIILAMTTQRFIFTDKIFRQICSVVSACSKKWRIVRMVQYDAYQMENCTNLELLKPICKVYWFATDKDYARYSTHELVENMEKKGAAEFLSTEEILNNVGYDGDFQQVNSLKKKFKKAFKK